MTLKLWTCNKPLSLNGLGGGGVGSLSRPDTIPAKNYWPFDVSRITTGGKTPMYNFTGISSAITTGFYMKPDGTAIYTLQSDNIVRRHSLGTAWDIATAYHDQSSYAVVGVWTGGNNNQGGGTNYAVQSNPELGKLHAFDDTTARGLWLKNDGTKVYYADEQYVYETNLSVAWDISSLSPTYTQRYDFSSILSNNMISYTPTSFYFKADGSKFFLISHRTFYDASGYYNVTLFPINRDAQSISQGFGDSSTRVDCYIESYDLSTNYDISTLTHVHQYAPQAIGYYRGLRGMSFSSDGKKLYGIENGYQMFYAELSTGYDLSTVYNTTYSSMNEVHQYYNNGLGLNIMWRTDSGYDGTMYYYPHRHNYIHQDKPRSGSTGYGTTNQDYGVNSEYQRWYLANHDTSYTGLVSPDNYPSADTNWIGWNNSQFYTCQTFAWNNDGTKIFVYDANYYNPSIHTISCLTPYDIRTISRHPTGIGSGSYSYRTIQGFKLSSSAQSHNNMQFNSDGTKCIFGVGKNYYTHQNAFQVVTLSTGYDFSSYQSIDTFYVQNSNQNPQNSGWTQYSNCEAGCAAVTPSDGLHLYASHTVSTPFQTKIFQWSVNNNNFNIGGSGQTTLVQDFTIPDGKVSWMSMSPDGTQLLILVEIRYDSTYPFYPYSSTTMTAPPELISYTLSTPYDISTATRDKVGVIGNLNVPWNHYYNGQGFAIVSNGPNGNGNGIYHLNNYIHSLFKIDVR